MGSESQEKVQSKVTRQKRVLLLALILIITTTSCIVALLVPTSTKNGVVVSSSLQNKNDTSSYSNQLSFYQTACNDAAVASILQQSETTTTTTNTKPIWMPMLPFTIPEPLYKDLINPMTKTSHGAKSFYSSIRGKLRHCIGNGLSVTCLNVHPSVEMTKGMPDSKSNEFNPNYIMILRNPMTVIPAGYNAKAAKYSGLIGQLPEKEWRRVRDEWFDGMLESWEKLIVTWKATKYNVGMYLVYEDLLDFDRGVETMKKLRLFLLKEGFEVIPQEDLGCIWFKAVGKDTLERYYRKRYDYDDYIPGFTMEQKDKMIQRLRRMTQDFHKDYELVSILEKYINDIENNIKIDGVYP